MNRTNAKATSHLAVAIGLMQTADTDPSPEATERAARAAGLWSLAQPAGVNADLLIASVVARLSEATLPALADLDTELRRELRRRARRGRLAGVEVGEEADQP